MTNFEFYKDEILKIVANGDDIALLNGKPVACDGVSCNDCDRDGNCYERYIIDWLYAEHVEKPKINKRTKMFFDAIETGWVARDSDGDLTLFTKKPNKEIYQWTNVECGGDWFRISGCFIYRFLVRDLCFIKWEDKEPWSVEDIRKLEVV